MPKNNHLYDEPGLTEITERLTRLNLPPARAEFRSSLRAQLLTKVSTEIKPVTLGTYLRHIWQQVQTNQKRSMHMTIAVILALIVALAGGGTAYASQSALPGDALYGVKTGIENLQLVLTAEEDQGEYYLELAERRLGEIQALVADERYQDIAQAAQLFINQIEQADEHPGAEGIEIATTRAVNMLTTVLGQAPEPARLAIENALQQILWRSGPPTDVPGGLPTDVPVVPPTNVPGGFPTDVPVIPSTDVPGDLPTDVPVIPSTEVPSDLPTDVPVIPSTEVPGGTSVVTPIPPQRP